MPQHFPPEIWDLVIDHLHNDPKTLKQCSLVSGSWANRTRKDRFKKIGFKDGSWLPRWKKDFPNLSNSPAPHTKFLYLSHKTEITKAHPGVIELSTSATHMEGVEVVAHNHYHDPVGR